MPRKLYLDESGDLGWNFTNPYRQGGSSRFLTIAYLIVPDTAHHLPQRIVRDTYSKFRFNTAEEKKGSALSDYQINFFIQQTNKLFKIHPDFLLGAITVKKLKVLEHIRADGNKLYNYMIKLGVLGKIKKSPFVKVIRDARSIKVQSGNSLIDYLQTTLWFELGSATRLQDIPCQSHTNNNIIFIDWVTHIIWSYYEDTTHAHFNTLLPSLSESIELFF